MIGGGEAFFKMAGGAIIIKRKKRKDAKRFPRKIKKWVKRSCHYAGMHGKLPLWSNNEWTKHICDRACEFHKPPRKIWHIKSKRHRKNK